VVADAPLAGSTVVKYDPLLHIVLVSPEIPPNTGNVARTCVAIGAKLWLVRPLGFDIGEKAVRRAGLDYWPHLEWQVVENWDELTQHLAGPLAAARAWFFTKSATRHYTDARYERGDVLVFGCETRGLPPELLARHQERTLRIPIRQQVRSLNLSVAAGIAMFEAMRQMNARIAGASPVSARGGALP
jgi:tRNA (cytidine/uridine-2'-O-)-methyltransferase